MSNKRITQIRRTWLLMFSLSIFLLLKVSVVAQDSPFTPFVAWNPNGQYLAVGHGTALSILNATTMQVLNTFTGLSYQETSADWSPDGNRLALVNGADVEIWQHPWDSALANKMLTYGYYNDLTPPRLKQEVEPVESVIWSPDGTQVAVNIGGAVYLVNAQTGIRVKRIVGDWENIPNLDWSNDGRLVLANWNPFAYVVDPYAEGVLNYFFIGDFSTLKSNVNSVAFSPDGSKLAVGTSDGNIALWTETASADQLEQTPDFLLKTLSGEQGRIHALAWSSTGQYLASGSQDGKIRFWDTQTGGLLDVIELGEAAWVFSISWSPDGSKLAYGDAQGNVITYDATQLPGYLPMATGNTETYTPPALVGGTGLRGQSYDNSNLTGFKLNRPDANVNFNWGEGAPHPSMGVDSYSLYGTMSVFAQIEDEVYSVRWSPDGTMIAISGGVAGCDRTNPNQFAIRIFSASTGEVIKNLIGMTCTSSKVDWSPDGTKLVSFNYAQAVVHIWEVATGNVLRTVPFETQGMLSTVWSPNGQLIASAFPSDGVILWDPNTGQIVTVIRGGTVVDWSPDSSKVVTGSSYNNEVQIQEATTGTELLLLPGTTGETSSVSWSLDGNRIASIAGDSKLRVWNASDGQLLLSVDVPHDVVDVEWSPDTSKLATGSIDGIVRVWDGNTGTQISSFTNPDRIYSVSWSPDGSKLAFGGKDGTLEIVQAVSQSPTSTPSPCGPTGTGLAGR